MEYLLVHYAANGFPWGIWRSPDENVYDGAHPAVIEQARRAVADCDPNVPWPEWIDTIAWNPPEHSSRWDMYKTDEPVELEELLRNLRGGLSYAEYVLMNGDGGIQTLSAEDRDSWLKNHSQDSADWTDEDISMAKGAGLN